MLSQTIFPYLYGIFLPLHLLATIGEVRTFYSTMRDFSCNNAHLGIVKFEKSTRVDGPLLDR